MGMFLTTLIAGNKKNGYILKKVYSNDFSAKVTYKMLKYVLEVNISARKLNKGTFQYSLQFYSYDKL